MKVAKKILLATTALCALSCAAVGFAACTPESPEHSHSYGEWSVTKPTDDAEGSAVKTCSADGCADKTVTVILPKLSDSVYAKTNDTATCAEGGTATYVYAKDGNTVTFVADTPATEHAKLEKFEKKKTCTEDGFKAYWQCPECETKFDDEDGEHKIDAPVVVPKGHAVPYAVAQKSATCSEEGTQEYWQCPDCDVKFSDPEHKNEIENIVTTPKDENAHKPLEHVGAVPATCSEKGFAEYWYCPGCLQKFSDAEGQHKIDKAEETPVAHGTLVHVEAVTATCQADGWEEYWYCPNCGQKFSDANGKTKITKPAATTASHAVEAKAGTEYVSQITMPNNQTATQGNLSTYYQCNVCGKMFADEACATEINNPACGGSKQAIFKYGSNVMYPNATSINAFFKAETAGCYAIVTSGGSLTKIGYGTKAGDYAGANRTGVVVYNNNGWVTDKEYYGNFAKCSSQDKIGNALYVDMNAGDVIGLAYSSITANQIFSVDVQKAEGEKVLILGENDIAVNEAGVQTGVEWTFTATADNFYQLSVPKTGVALVMIDKDGAKTVVASTTEETYDYIFHALRGETVKFYMSADTMGGVTFPVEYTVTVTNKVSLPQFEVDKTTNINTTSAPGAKVDAIVNIEAGKAGTYIFEMNLKNPRAGRNYYNIYVNGVKIATFQAGNTTAEITLEEGLNTITIENAMAQSAAEVPSIIKTKA